MPDRVPVTTPERLEEIRAYHGQIRTRCYVVRDFEAVEDLLAMVAERDRSIAALQADLDVHSSHLRSALGILENR